MNFIQQFKNRDMRTQRFEIRISPTERSVINEAAAMANVPVAEILRVGAALWIQQHVGGVVNVDALLG